MTVWKNAEIELYYADDTPSTKSKCQVRIANGEIVISDRTDGVETYSGRESSNGHFELNAQSGGGKAVLHRSPNSDSVEGSWFADGWEGMCRIDLGDAEIK
jgi:hypothetical protein